MLYLLPYTMHLGRIVAIVLECLLGNDTAAVQVAVDPMDRNAVNLHPIGHRLFHRVSALESRQQRRMYVDDTALIGTQQHISHYTHITRKAHKIDFGSIQQSHDFRLECLLGRILLGGEHEGVSQTISTTAASSLPSAQASAIASKLLPVPLAKTANFFITQIILLVFGRPSNT